MLTDKLRELNHIENPKRAVPVENGQAGKPDALLALPVRKECGAGHAEYTARRVTPDGNPASAALNPSYVFGAASDRRQVRVDNATRADRNTT